MVCWFYALLLILVQYAAALGDGYGTGGISKYTLSASEPIAFYSFLQQYFPVNCQDAGTPCNVSLTCGQSGRAALCLDEACTYPGSGNHVFGLHLVNLSARPYGHMDTIDVERHFTDKLRKAFNSNAYDAFMDIAVVLYAADLDKYAIALRKDSVPFMVLEWNDDAGETWYSLIVQVSTSQMILELVAKKVPASTPTVAKDNLQRLPAFVFDNNNVSVASPDILVPLAVSKAVSNISEVSSFYKEEMFATETHNSHSGPVILRAFSLQHSSLLVRVVQRPSSATFGSFKVWDLEDAKFSAHNMAHVDNFCGVDKWYDNHFAYDAFWNRSLDEFKTAFDKHGRTYHIFGDCKPSKFGGPGTNIYVVDPTGDSVQVDGTWKRCPHGGSGDALQNPCSQGTCSKYHPSQPCTSKINELCAAVKIHNTSCTDCCYLNWEHLAATGCNNADVVNYCFATAQSHIDLVI